jgi:menaquinone-specific isochorismate synthase
LSFDGSDDWEQFGAGRFLIPRLLLKDGKLHVNVMDREDVVAATLDVQQLNFEFGDLPTNLPAPTNIRHSPTSDGWQSNVDEALTLIRSEVLEKVVLARKTTMTFDEPLNPIIVAALIAKATYDCYLFCFQFGDQRAFVGATPERLFKRSGHQLLSQIVAGTRPRGMTSGDDQRLAYELLNSDKDQLEHDIVRKSIRQKLHKFVDHLDVDTQASVLRLARKQHLCSEVQGKLKEGIEEGALLKRLHPTPAVGGYPTENALPEIARLEPFNRGWYAAPIGWIGANDAEFVVGIRSGLVEGNELSLFSGAGIVKGSIPDQEWEEVDNKIRDFVDILGTST